MHRRTDITGLDRLDLSRSTAAWRDDLDKRLRRVRAGKAAEEDVHRLRSNGRRMEAALWGLVSVTGPEGRRVRRLHEAVRRLRKKAGKVRDADVSHELVRTLCAGRGEEAKDTRKALVAILDKDRDKAMKKLTRAAARHRAVELPRRLKVCFDDAEPDLARVERAIGRCLGRAERMTEGARLAPRALHCARIVLKRVRDLAETGSPALGRRGTLLASSADRLCDTLGRAQDLIVVIELVERACEGTVGMTRGLAALRDRLTRRHRAAHAKAVSRLRGAQGLRRLRAVFVDDRGRHSRGRA